MKTKQLKAIHQPLALTNPPTRASQNGQKITISFAKNRSAFSRKKLVCQAHRKILGIYVHVNSRFLFNRNVE